ncbi:MAG TPA: molybdenum cofactor biosynthesis protein MoaE [Ferruginibacter sp.]|nr:molybdenum cofactor biosynthesis protein MoaE [Ferruginibacter sp.]
MQHLSAHTIDTPALFSGAHHPKAGAVVLFSGETRDSSHGKEVIYLDYEAQENIAEKMIADILQQAKERWQLTIALAVHRTGKVAVSESAVVVITASAHRSEAYAANRYIIDRIKHEVPIWKCEYFSDGSKEWGGNCNCVKLTGDVHKHVYEFEDK